MNEYSELSDRAQRSVRSAIVAVLAIWSAVSVETANAQSCSPTCPPIVVYGGPIHWGSGTDIPAWYDSGWPTGAYEPEGTYSDPIQNCAIWEADHPRPDDCEDIPPNVSTNGCGPAGWGWLQPDGHFTSACNAHDVCYSQFSANRGSCDTGLRNDMHRTCQDNFGEYYDFESHSWQRHGSVEDEDQCHGERLDIIANMTTFDSWMASRFVSLQTTAECRAWHNARANESDCDPP